MRRVLMLVACLVLALPGVQAANGVNLLLDGPGRVTASAPSGSAATVDGSYDLSLTYTGQHRLLVSSSVRTCATCAGLDHAAQWTLGAESLQSTRTVTATSASSYAAGNLDVHPARQGRSPAVLPGGRSRRDAVRFRRLDR
jgi:hypothetical protein